MHCFYINLEIIVSISDYSREVNYDCTFDFLGIFFPLKAGEEIDMLFCILFAFIVMLTKKG